MTINPDKIKANLEADARKKARQSDNGHKLGCSEGECVQSCPIYKNGIIFELRKEVTAWKGRSKGWEKSHHEWFDVAARCKDEVAELRKDVAHWKEEYNLTFAEAKGLRSSLEAAEHWKGKVDWQKKAAHWEAEHHKSADIVTQLNGRLTLSKRNYFNLDMEHQAFKEVQIELNDKYADLQAAHIKSEQELEDTQSQVETVLDLLSARTSVWEELRESYAQLKREALRPAQDYEEQRALASQRGQALNAANAELGLQDHRIEALQDIIDSKARNIEGLGKQTKRLREYTDTQVELARDRLGMLHQQEIELTKAVTEATRLRMLLTDSELERSKLVQLYDSQGRAAATYGHQAVTGAERMVVLQAERDGAADSARRLDREVVHLKERLANMEGDLWDERAKHEEAIEQLKERLAKQVRAKEDLEVRVKHWSGEVQTYKDHIKEGTLVDVSVVDDLNRVIGALDQEVEDQKAKQAEVVRICDAQWRCAAMMGQRVQTPREHEGIVVGYQINLTPEDGGSMDVVVDVDISDTETSSHLRYWSIDKVTCL